MSTNWENFPDVFGEIVTAANTNIQSNSLLTELLGKNLVYEFGTLLELSKRLDQKKDSSYKYPLVWLVWERSENEQKYSGQSSNKQYAVSPRIFIADFTNKNYSSIERSEIVFKPILIPIYRALIEMTPRNKYINLNGQIDHIRHDNYFWGVNDQGRNFFNDTLDSIELKINTLTVNYRCG